MSRAGTGRRGMSLLELVVASVMIGIALIAGIAALNDYVNTNEAILATDSLGAAEEEISRQVFSMARDFILGASPGCDFGTTPIQGTMNRTLASGMALALMTDAAALPNVAFAGKYTQARTRCAAAAGALAGGFGAVTNLHFCLSPTINSTGSAGNTMFFTHTALVEGRFGVWDTIDNRYLRCNEIAAKVAAVPRPPMLGHLYYAVYWVNQTKNSKAFKLSRTYSGILKRGFVD